MHDETSGNCLGWSVCRFNQSPSHILSGGIPSLIFNSLVSVARRMKTTITFFPTRNVARTKTRKFFRVTHDRQTYRTVFVVLHYTTSALNPMLIKGLQEIFRPNHRQLPRTMSSPHSGGIPFNDFNILSGLHVIQQTTRDHTKQPITRDHMRVQYMCYISIKRWFGINATSVQMYEKRHLLLSRFSRFLAFVFIRFAQSNWR